MAVDTTACERNGETASRHVARFYEVKKGRKPEMVEGTSWMVRWKAGGKAVYNALSTLGSVGIYELYETDRKLSSMLNPVYGACARV